MIEYVFPLKKLIRCSWLTSYPGNPSEREGTWGKPEVRHGHVVGRLCMTSELVMMLKAGMLWMEEARAAADRWREQRSVLQASTGCRGSIDVELSLRFASERSDPSQQLRACGPVERKPWQPTHSSTKHRSLCCTNNRGTRG